MKLAEALAERADLRVRVVDLQRRLESNVLVQEGDEAAESPPALLEELQRTLAALRTLMVRINRTNLVARLDDGRTLTEAIAQRDVLKMEISALRKAIQEAQPTGRFSFRTGRAEIKSVPTISVVEWQKIVDQRQRDYRLLDTAIQMVNWEADLE